MKVGAYLIPFYKQSELIYEDKDYKKYFKRFKLNRGYVYKKIEEIKGKAK